LDFLAVKDIGKSRIHGAHNGDKMVTSDLPQEILVEFVFNQAHGLIDDSIP
jgi:hypothetical protein